MRVVVPFASRIHPLAEHALRAHVPDAERVDVGGDEFAYRRLLGELWAAGEDFLVVEHDIEVNPVAVGEAKGCPRPWCAHPYRHGRVGLLTEAMGFTRFRHALMAAFPDALERSDEIATPPPNWMNLDGRLNTALRAAGYAPCKHRTEVAHHHWWPTAQGTWCTCGSHTQDVCVSGAHHADAEECSCDGIDRRRRGVVLPPRPHSTYGPNALEAMRAAIAASEGRAP